MEPDFSGWATKANIKCSDGRTISSDAFKHNDGMQVPLVWQHGHSSAENVLGHGILKHMADGTRIDAYFNKTKQGQNAKDLVEHGDIKHLSIYANDLVEKPMNGGRVVLHGNIRETSLVLAGANKGAVIDTVNIRHSDGDLYEVEDEAIIFTGLELFHAADTDGDGGTSGQGDDAPGDTTDKSLQEIWDSMTPEQQDMMNYVVGQTAEAVENDDDAGDGGSDTDAEHSDINKPGEDDLSHQEGADPNMSRNVFESQSATIPANTRGLMHATINPETGNKFQHVDELFSIEDRRNIFQNAQKPGMTLKSAFEEAVIAHGITPMDVLFPEYKNIDNTPQFNTRRMEWVAPFLGALSHTPFSRVKSIVADITMDEARAKGYVKGNIKREEWFSVSKRTTSPTTVYKKQQLDRDDIIDIVDFDVIAWMKAEMDTMLKEEIARAILIGDGRDISDVDKIADPQAATSGAGLRSVVNEHDLYKTDVNLNLGTTPNYEQLVEECIRAKRFYKGSGTPTMYTTWDMISNMLLIKDTLGRRLYMSISELATTIGVSDIVPVEVMESGPANLMAVIFNPADYNVGADKGGEVNLFDFFDIDYNQYKYLGETRISGALTKVKAALVIWSVPSSDTPVVPVSPTFNYATGVATVPSETGVVYKDGNGNTLTAGAQDAIDPDTSIVIQAVPASGYYFEFSGNQLSTWTFTRPNPDGANSNS
jgi:hypothetical protein